MIIDRIHEFNKFGMVLGLSRMEELLRRLKDDGEDEVFRYIRKEVLKNR